MSRYALRSYCCDRDGEGVWAEMLYLREWRAAGMSANEFCWTTATPEHPPSVFTGPDGLTNAKAAVEFLTTYDWSCAYAVVRLDDDCEEP